ncbi:MAG: GNAT family N-acetyltransferase [Paracoccaceae bacterium]
MENWPDSTRLMAAIDVTWPPARMMQAAGWTLREGAGGGKRVSATSGAGDVPEAEAAMRAMGQARMFRLTPEDADLDAKLAEAGYRVVDPVALYAAPAADLVGEQSHLAAAYRCQARPAVMEEIWDQGGIGPARRAIMDRCTAPKMHLMSRGAEKPAGAAFWAVDGDVAMIHAIEVLSDLRRQGGGKLLMELAARMTLEHGATWLALAVTEANISACALYEKLGMKVAGRYHYRIAEGDIA